MNLFSPPVVRRVKKACPVLEGGRTRLLVSISGWGRLTLSHASADGTITERRLRLYGGARELFVDVLPPGVVTIDVRNLFGVDTTTLTIDTDLPGIVEFQVPLVLPLPEPRVRLPNPKVDHPVVLHNATPQLQLGTIAVKALHVHTSQGE